ncbi:uncharacterized protein LOC127846417 isoform X3 [Dreissena polymorpha]|uniref:uncharacterized protein LOC127846417 isoform X3 n=1 Tax=Dreissena polymorpha TaxID=45954 RepID=UPI0022646DB0|nr:uncharacterized protein LOC127846417 isoform X3 [Dreissena polymorpha]
MCWIHGETVEKVSSDFWAWRLSISKEYSTTLGSYKYNDRLDSYTDEKLEDMKMQVDDFLIRLSRVNSSALSGETLISFNVLKSILETVRDGYEWKDYQPLNPINFLELWFAGLDMFVVAQPFDTEGDFVNYVRRIEGGPQQMEEMIGLSRRAIAKGHTSHIASVSRVPDNIDGMVKPPRESALYAPLNKTIANNILGKNAAVMDKRLQDAISSFNVKLLEVKAFLIDDYMPNTRPGLGIGSLPRGKENYQACLRFHTSTNITAKEVHDKGLEEVDRIEKLIRQKMVSIGFPITTKISELYTSLSSDPKFLFEREDALANFNKIIFERVKPLMPKYFRNLPDLPLEVRPYPADGPSGEYKAGTADGSRPGIFYVQLTRKEDNPSYSMVAFALHEALPGHHNQESYGLVANIPPFMRSAEWISYSAPYFFPFFNSFSEGWGLYSEFLGEEMGIYRDDYELLGRYGEEMVRAVRLVIDTGIHEFHWTRDGAIAYMHTYYTKQGAENDIDRYSTWPGQAVGYKIGELKLKELRKKASDSLGSKFNLADFHYTVLRYGMMPLSLLEYVVDQWIAEQKADSGQVGKKTGTDGKGCNRAGTCDKVIPLGGQCGSSHYPNTCDQKAGARCHHYGCCRRGGIECNKKYCLCDTARGWVYNNTTKSCKFVGGRQDKRGCLDAPFPFKPASCA